MKRWLAIAAMMLCLVMAAAYAEGADQVVIYFQDGAKVLLPADIANDSQKLEAYCRQYFPGRMYGREPDAFIRAATISQEYAEKINGSGSGEMFATLKKLGVHTSVVTTIDGDELIVPTAELTIRNFHDKAHHVAFVSAPRTGTAVLREKPANNGKTVAKCAAGRVVAVLEITNATFTKILYDGVEGYIRTDCLVFQDTAKAPEGTGTVHVKNAVDGKSKVVIRNTASKSNAKVATIPTGTVLSVYGSSGDWYIVEGDGWLGYIPKLNLKLNEE